jgi:hypothetical protein
MKVKAFSQLSIHYSDRLDTQYTVDEKPFPANLLTEHAAYKGRRIRWITNFGFRRKDNAAAVTGTLDEDYAIELDQDPSPRAVLVFFDGSRVRELDARPSDTAPGKVRATLNLGDPPIGWG